MTKVKIKNNELNKLNKSLLGIEEKIESYHKEKEQITNDIKEVE